MTTLNLAKLLIHEPAEQYHDRSRELLTSHRLADFRKCPLLYLRKKIGLVPDEERPAYLLGRAAHTLILEGRERFDTEFAVGGPVNPRTNQPFGPTTKAFAEWAEAQGKPVLTTEQAQLAEWMRSAVMGHDLARQLLADGEAEGVVRCTYQGVPSQIRMDWFNPASGSGIVDLKTTDDLTWFEADARRYGYAHQLAFYRAVFAAAAGVLPLEVPIHLIAVEKKEPFRCGVWRIAQDVLAIAQKDNETAIERLKRCERDSVWPTGYEEPRTFDWV